MLQRTRVSKGSSVFWGNASLDGQLSHLLEGLNVTQVLPLEPPDAWARRQEDVTTYLLYFRQLVKLFSKERPINCKWYPGGHRDGSHGGRGAPPALPGHHDSSVGKGTGTRPCAKPRSRQKEPFCGAGNFLPGAHLGNRAMLNLPLPLGRRAGGCSVQGWWGGGTLPVPWLHNPCTLPAPCLHPACIPPASSLHPACGSPAPCLYPPCIPPTPCLHLGYIPLHPACTPPAPRLHPCPHPASMLPAPHILRGRHGTLTAIVSCSRLRSSASPPELRCSCPECVLPSFPSLPPNQFCPSPAFLYWPLGSTFSPRGPWREPHASPRPSAPHPSMRAMGVSLCTGKPPVSIKPKLCSAQRRKGKVSTAAQPWEKSLLKLNRVKAKLGGGRAAQGCCLANSTHNLMLATAVGSP